MWSTTALLLLLVGAFAVNASDEASDAVVQKFLARIDRSIKSKDVAVISGLFQPGFVFKGCKGVYDKKKVVGILSNIPSEAKLNIVLKSSEDLGSSIKYRVTIGGIDKSEIIAEFVLNKVDQQLESGNVPACQKTLRSAKLSSDAVVQEFLADMKHAIMSRDKAGYSNRLADDLVIRGCKGTYNKDQSIDILKRVDTENPFTYEFYSSHYAREGLIEFRAWIRGVWDDFTANFVLDPTKNQLIFGKYECKAKRSRPEY